MCLCVSNYPQKKTAIISLNIDIFFFVTEIQYVFYVVVSEILNIILPGVKDAWMRHGLCD